MVVDEDISFRTWNGSAGNDKQLDIAGEVVIDGNLSIDKGAKLKLPSNDTDENRALNRRVGLVKVN